VLRERATAANGCEEANANAEGAQRYPQKGAETFRMSTITCIDAC
jgi:hypothetical protein